MSHVAQMETVAPIDILRRANIDVTVAALSHELTVKGRNGMSSTCVCVCVCVCVYVCVWAVQYVHRAHSHTHNYSRSAYIICAQHSRSPCCTCVRITHCIYSCIYSRLVRMIYGSALRDTWQCYMGIALSLTHTNVYRLYCVFTYV